MVRNHSVRFITEATLVLVFSSDTSIALDNLVYIAIDLIGPTATEFRASFPLT